MTIDERLEKLTERHEALTQMAELENIRALVRIAEIHEKRLTEIEFGE